MKKELRLVLTRNCNYDCYFCHGEGMKKTVRDMLNADDYEFLVKFCKEEFGWNTVTLTGGEPLIRTDIATIIDNIIKYNVDITIVSNGELILEKLDSFRNIKRLNISIHSVNEEKYNKIIQRKNKLQKVIKNLYELRNINKNIEIRINMTIVKNINDSSDELKDMINLAKSLNASIKIIELFSEKKEEIVTINELKNKLLVLDFKILEENTYKIIMYNGTTKIILSKIFCAVARDRYNPNKYCNELNDFFLSPDGILKLCRYSKEEINILNEVKTKDIDGLKYKMYLANKMIGKDCPMVKDDEELAINGGTPILVGQEGRFNHPKITPNIEKAVIEQLNDTISIYDNSNIFQKFESEFSKYHNRKYGIVTSSGTSALHSIYDAINLNENDEVICPIYTFYATVTPIFQTGAKPVFVDCDETGNIDYTKIEEKINKNTKAIMVTHMWGYPCKMDKIKEIANKYNLYLLEDCSHAHGGEYKGKKLGEWGDAAAFSLQGNKIITGGEGGIVITNNKYIYKNCVLLGHYNKRCKKQINPYSTDYKYAVTGKGLKLRAHPLAIRIAYEMFKELDYNNYIKQKNSKLIEEAVNRIDGLSINVPYEDSKCSYYAMIIKYDKTKFNDIPIEKFIEALNAEGGIEFDKPGSTCPLNRLEIFKNPNYFYKEYHKIINSNESFINADKFYDNSFKLPIWYEQSDIDIVIKYCDILIKVSKFYKERRK